MDTQAMNFRSFSLVTLAGLWADMKYGDETTEYTRFTLRTIKSVLEEHGLPVNSLSVQFSDLGKDESALTDLVTFAQYMDQMGYDRMSALAAFEDVILFGSSCICAQCLFRLAAGEITLAEVRGNPCFSDPGGDVRPSYLH